MTKMTSALAAALIASVSFAGAALAEGDYYQGAQKTGPATTIDRLNTCLLYTSPSPRDRQKSRMPSSA